MQSPPDHMPAAAIDARFTNLLGYGWRRDLSEAIGMTLPRLSEQFSQDRVRPIIIAHLEWMEATPLAKWPERWAKLRDRAKAKHKKEAKAA